MIKHSQNIIINANSQKVWKFLIDFSRSLIFDKYYSLIELPQKYSVNGNSSFRVKAKYLFKNYYFDAKVVNHVPLKSIEIILSSNKNHHHKIFNLISLQNQTQISYTYIANFDSKIKNIIMFFILKASYLSELAHIKKAIESLEDYTEHKKVHSILY